MMTSTSSRKELCSAVWKSGASIYTSRWCTSDFFEVKRAAAQAIQLAQGLVLVRVPADGLNDGDKERLALLDKWCARGIGGAANILEQAAQVFGSLLARFEVKGIAVPVKERMSARLLRARMIELQDALDHARIWPPQAEQGAADDGRRDAGGSAQAGA